MVKRIVALALILSLFMFISGYLLASALEEKNILEIKAQTKEIYDLFSTVDLILLLFPEKCPEKPHEILFPIYSKLEDLRKSFELLTDSRLLIDKEKYLTISTEYSLLNLRAWILSEKLRKNCRNFHTALFVFLPDDPKSIAARLELEKVKKALKDKFLLFHVDITVDNPAIISFRNLWNITEAPCVIIDSRKICGFGSIKNECEKLLKENVKP